MMIQEMTEKECLEVLGRTRIARLACAHENQPYVVPIYFVYEGGYLYAVTTLGQKVDWMRSNPLVCVEIDEVESSTQWTSIVIFGQYEELPDSPESGKRWDHHRLAALEEKRPECFEGAQVRQYAHDLLQRYPEWWEAAASSAKVRKSEEALEPVYYRIRIEEMTGRRANPSADQ
jgi:uncharacterized protein